MIHIPTSEIKQPQLHADTLGFTFVWNGHFLRGIYPDSVEQAKSYFESGFIDEVVAKGLFPKTWISEYENEKFGMIIEHEMVSPVLYATEWNSAMLKDAALMVLDIAEIGWRYGYNMVDCHKLNVMFHDNSPIYVDLGSFIPMKEKDTTWHPYPSFLRSYYYIIDVWKDGASQIAKRMMAPGNEMRQEDYLLYKHNLYKKFPSLLKLRIKLSYIFFSVVDKDLNSLSNRLSKEPKGDFKGVKAVVKLLKRLKLHPSQNFNRIRNSIKRINLNKVYYERSNNILQDNLTNIIKRILAYRTITVIDCDNLAILKAIKEVSSINGIVSIQQNEKFSNAEYNSFKGEKGICSTHFKLLNNSINIKGQEPEKRLCSEIVLIPNYEMSKGNFAVENACVFFERCATFSITGKLIVHINGYHSEDKGALLNRLQELSSIQIEFV